MSANQFRKIEEKTAEKSALPTQSIARVATPIRSVITGDFMKKDKVLRSLPFLFFLTFLGICYIANGYYAEKTIRELYKTNVDVKELRSEYITIKSELEIMKQQSQIALIIKGMGLKESTTPPKKIVVKSED